MSEEERYAMKPRGVGLDAGCHCFICGENLMRKYCSTNFSSFVNTREEGALIVAAIKYGAWLDYRSFEPSWIQVKTTACKVHEDLLEEFQQLILDLGYFTLESLKQLREKGASDE